MLTIMLFVVTDSPGSPGEPDVEEIGGDFVSLKWEKPRSDGGGGIKGYIIEKREAGAQNWSRCNMVPTPTNMFNVPNLIEDREYEFRVFAVNEAGESKPSSATRQIKVKDPKGKSISQVTRIFGFCSFDTVKLEHLWYAIIYFII